MDRNASHIQGIGQGDFVDETEEQVKEQAIPTGKGRVESRSSGAGPLEPELVCAEDGRLGWRVRLPRPLPLATPAIAEDSVLLGGGFGSHELYALDAGTGSVRWQRRTEDDGPTAAVVAGKYVAFNTESCSIYVLDVRTGDVAWEAWLGDPLMAQPAIHDSVVFMAYPGRGQQHHLAAFDLATGTKRWATQIIADLVTAPVVMDDAVYGTALDGTLYQIDRATGERRWSLAGRATSAPWIHRGKIYISLREEGEGGPEARAAHGVLEGYASGALHNLGAGFGRSFTRRRAEYLRGSDSESVHGFYAKQDAGVGFVSAPAAAKISLSARHLGLGTVSAVWAYQGSRPAVFDDGIFSTLDDIVQRVDLVTKRPIWRARLLHANDSPLGRVWSPPAVTAKRIYLTSVLGDLVALERATGRTVWALNVGAPILAQPAVAGGRVYCGTAEGILYAFDADDADLRGWPMWGGGAGHNGVQG
jgi:outer membrane protein assembly factor BamB